MTDEHDAEDDTVDGDDTGEDDGDDATHDELGLHHTHRGHTNAGLGGSVGAAKHGEDERAGTAEGAEESGIGGAKLSNNSFECEHFLFNF